MTRQEKQAVIEDLTEKFKETPYFYFTNPGNMDVEKTNKFRELVYKEGLEYRVAKNTLIAKALKNLDTTADYAEVEEKALKGFTGIIFSPEKGNAPAKMLKKFYGDVKDAEKQWPKLKAASVDEALYFGHESLGTLESIKSKDELVADVVALLQSPMKNVISALQGSSGNKIAGLIKALEERAS